MDRSAPNPGHFDPTGFGPWITFFGALSDRMWPRDFVDLDKAPKEARVLFVGNHSGMGVAELCVLSIEWFRRFGSSRPVASMAHPGAFKVFFLKQLLHSLGAVEATKEGAKKAVDAGVPLLVFPGGDHEATRPFWRANEVDFNGRTGWVRLAREHGLTIVPLAITGSHKTLPILAGGKAVAWGLGLKPILGVHRAPLSALSLASIVAIFVAMRKRSLLARVAVAWPTAWLTMVIPWLPSRLGFHFLPAIPAEEVATASDAEIYGRVTSAIQATLAKTDRGPNF